MRIQLFFCLLLMPGWFLFGQHNFNIGDFLSTIKQSEQVILQRDKMRYLSSLPHHIRRIEKLEFRTETKDFDWKKQEYLLRISPNSRNSISTHRRYYQTLEYSSEMELEQTIGAALKIRYDLMVNYIFIQKILEMKNKMEVLYTDKVTLLNRSMALPDFDVLDFLEVEEEHQQNARDILDLNNELLAIRQQIQELKNAKADFELNEEPLITVANIHEILADAKSATTTSHPLLKVQSAKIYNHMLEYEWEVAQTKFSLGYIQAQYGYDPLSTFKETFSIGVGFEIPLKGTANLNLNELLINKLEAESEYRNLENQLNNEKIILFRQLENRIQKYELVKQQLEEGVAEFALQEYGKIVEAPPMALLKLRENTLKNQLLLKKLEWDLYQNYIAYLDLTGLLQRVPLRNYLSKNLMKF